MGHPMEKGWRQTYSIRVLIVKFFHIKWILRLLTLYQSLSVVVWPWPATKGRCSHSITPPPAGVGRRMEIKRQKLMGWDESSLTDQQTKETVITIPIRRI